MSKVISNIGHSPNQPDLKTWSVPDGEPEEQAPQPREISHDEVQKLRARFMQKAEQDTRVDLEKAKKRVDIITGIGRLTRNIPVKMPPDGDIVNFSLRTLKGYENRDLAQVIEKAERASLPNGNIMIMPTSLYAIRICSLKYSLYAIDDVDIDVVIGAVNLPYQEKIKARENLLHDMDDGLTGYLYTQYDKLTSEMIDGYIAKNEVQAKEAADAIHKSGA